MADGEHIQAAWRDLGRRLADLRQARSLTQHELARLLFVSRSTIANAETGHQKVPREFWENCDTVLGAGQTFAARYAEIQEAASRDRKPVARRRRQAVVPAAGSAAPRLATGEDPAQEPIVVTLAAEALDLATWAEQTNVGDMTIDALADGASRLGRDYLQKPPLPVLREAASAYRRVSGLLVGGHQSLRQTRDLYVVAGRLLAFLSWVSSDIGQPAAAEAHARAAWIMAEQADHDSLRAIVLIAQGKNAYWEGRFQEAADLARRGLECAPPNTARVLLASQLGDARQADGDIDGALEAQTAAKRARDQVLIDDTPGGIWACGRARQANYAMSVHLRAGNPAGALAEAETAQQAYEAGEDWAYGTWAQIRIASGIAHLIAGRVDGAASELGPILSMPPERRLATLTTRLGEVGMRLSDRRYQGSTEATELRQQIADYRAHAVTAGAAPGTVVSGDTERMRDHWWWRPGWRPGRRMYTWHFTFDGQTALLELVDAYQERLSGLPGLDPIPQQWLHLTTQGIGFTDEVPDADIDAIIAASRERLADVPLATVTMGPAVVDPEVVRLEVRPVDALTPVRRALRDAIAGVRGRDQVDESDEWTPHVSVAYSSAAGPMEPYLKVLDPPLKPVAWRSPTFS